MEVHAWTLSWLVQAKLLEGHGWRCTAVVVLNSVLRAADLDFGCLPRLDRRAIRSGNVDRARRGAAQNAADIGVLNQSLADALPRRMRRRSWQVAIVWHLPPY